MKNPPERVIPGFPAADRDGMPAACDNVLWSCKFPKTAGLHSRHTRESGYTVIADLDENRDVTAYWIIRLRG